MAPPNTLAAIRAILRADGNVLALVPAGRIWAGELPRDEAATMPRSNIVVAAAGGIPVRGRLQLRRPRIDVKCYGATPFEADTISDTVHLALKAITRVRVAAVTTPTLVHGLDEEGGPSALRDADGDWPLTLRTYVALVAEIAAP